MKTAKAPKTAKTTLFKKYAFLPESYDLVGRVPATEWEQVKTNALRYLQAGQYSKAGEDTLRNGGFELWLAVGRWPLRSEQEEFEVLYRTAKIEDYVRFERQNNEAKFQWIASAFDRLGHDLRFVTVQLDTSEDVRSVPVPSLRITSETVDRALSDAETLIQSNGASSGLDRVHTAFHGYLEAVCNDAHINFASGSDITHLFQLIRQSHPKLQGLDAEAAKRMDQIHRGMARIIDALNPIRNSSSLAHPNPVLLDEPEAMLAINCVRTLLHYLDNKL